MLKTISAAAVALSLIAAPAFAQGAGSATPTAPAAVTAPVVKPVAHKTTKHVAYKHAVKKHLVKKHAVKKHVVKKHVKLKSAKAIKSVKPKTAI